MLDFGLPSRPLRVLCLGAHSDDIEIGAGGTILSWIAGGATLEVTWCVLSAAGERAGEANASAENFLVGAAKQSIELRQFQDGYFGYQGAEIKHWFERLKRRTDPDLIFTHARGDAHQDHREVCQLTWNTFRDHVILEYEIPKWDGDLHTVNTYVPLSASVLDRKIELLHRHFGTQRSKDWFDASTFRGLARLRGMECRAQEGFAEGYTIRKAVLSIRASQPTK